MNFPPPSWEFPSHNPVSYIAWGTYVYKINYCSEKPTKSYLNLNEAWKIEWETVLYTRSRYIFTIFRGFCTTFLTLWLFTLNEIITKTTTLSNIQRTSSLWHTFPSRKCIELDCKCTNKKPLDIFQCKCAFYLVYQCIKWLQGNFALTYKPNVCVEMFSLW